MSVKTRKHKSRVRTRTRKAKKGGSVLRISPELLKKVVNTYKRHKNMPEENIRIKQKWFKGYYNQKVRNISMKNSDSDDYDENIEVINISGPEWEPVYGDTKDTKIPNVILPERKRKKTQFIRISSSYPKIKGQGGSHILHARNESSLYYMTEVSKKYDVNIINKLLSNSQSSRNVSQSIEYFTKIFAFLVERPLLLFNNNFLDTAEKKVEQYKEYLENKYHGNIPELYKTTLHNIVDIISQIKNNQLDKSKVVQNEYSAISKKE